MTVHEQFNANDSDLTIRSSDNVLFRVHRANLAITTGAFPGTGLATRGEDVELTEPSNVLEILFQFIYPKRHPNLQNIDFELLMNVAEAIEKYEVFPAMHTCEMRLREHLPERANRILIHAVRHDYSDLVNECALLLALSPPRSVVDKLPQGYILPWLNYQALWTEVFQKATNAIDACRSYSGEGVQTAYCSNLPITLMFCEPCRLCMRTWIADLEKMETPDLLREAIRLPAIDRYGLNERHCDLCRGNNCVHLSIMRATLEDSIKKIPLFSQLLRAPNVDGI